MNIPNPNQITQANPGKEKQGRSNPNQPTKPTYPNPEPPIHQATFSMRWPKEMAEALALLDMRVFNMARRPQT